MKITIIKRNGKEVGFNPNKITVAVQKATKQSNETINADFTDKVVEKLEKMGEKLAVETVQDVVEETLMECGFKKTAREYIKYRNWRTEQRELQNKQDKYITDVIELSNLENENANMNEKLFTAKKERVAGEVLKQYALKYLISPEVRKAYEDNLVYIHDLNSYSLGLHNCLLVDLGDVLKGGFKTQGGAVREPNSISSAMQLAAVVIQCTSNEMFGGCAISALDSALAPYVEPSFQKWIQKGLAMPGVDTNIPDDLTIENAKQYLQFPIVVWAYEQLEKEIEQSAEALYHNLNTMTSRAGNQLPFSSLNAGLDTSEAGRMITKACLKARMRGIGPNLETCVFPIGVFAYNEEINGKPGTPNYDLFQLAIESASKRIYPNFVNTSAPHLQKPTNRNEYLACMGCLEERELLVYKFNNVLYTDTFKNFFNKFGLIKPILNQFTHLPVSEIKTEDNLYIDVSDLDLQIYNSRHNKWTKIFKIIKNNTTEWLDLTFTNGRTLRVTPDHPMVEQDVNDEVIVKAADIKIGFKGEIAKPQYKQTEIDFGYKNINNLDYLWLLGFIAGDGKVNSGYCAMYVGHDEMDILDNIKRILAPFSYRVNYDDRPDKGGYYTVEITDKKLSSHLKEMFNKEKKQTRLLPSFISHLSLEQQSALIGGMIDADGYINNGRKHSKIQIGSTNKGLALQQFVLLQNLTDYVSIYNNHYNGKKPELIRYRIECVTTELNTKYIISAKKREKITTLDNFNKTVKDSKLSKVVKIETEELQDSYDIETDSGFFDVSGFVSHNCRTTNAPDRHGLKSLDGRGNISPVTMNLTKIALLHKQPFDEEKFFEELDDVIDVAIKALLERYEWQAKQKAASASFIYENQVLKGPKLKPEDEVREVLKHNSLSLGYLGLSNALVALIGEHHAESEKALQLGLKIVEHIHNRAKEASDKYDLNFGCYATPAESLCHKMAKANQKEFGIIPGVTDKSYVNNSHHVPVYANVSLKEKIDIEAQFAKYATAGNITYVELDGNARNNLEALEALVKYAMEKGITYFALNHKLDSCRICNYEGIIGEECPRCGAKDEGTNFCRLRRVTGYLTASYKEAFNAGKQAEVEDRICHTTQQKQEI